MEAPTLVLAEEELEIAGSGEDLDLLALELWQIASRPEAENEHDCAEIERWLRASCL